MLYSNMERQVEHQLGWKGGVWHEPHPFLLGLTDYGVQYRRWGIF